MKQLNILRNGKVRLEIVTDPRYHLEVVKRGTPERPGMPCWFTINIKDIRAGDLFQIGSYSNTSSVVSKHPDCWTGFVAKGRATYNAEKTMWEIEVK
jgi:hypothetical protein